jgi:sensor histidine kinase YesM
MNFFTNKNTDLIRVLVKNRWLWHIGFWALYAVFQARSYYVTVLYYDPKYLEYMLLRTIPMVLLCYATIWLFKRLIPKQNFILYFLIGIIAWVVYSVWVTSFQKYYLASIKEMAEAKWLDIYLYHLPTFIIFFFLITMSKYFKDNVIQQYYEKETRNQQIQVELKHLKAQIAPHFLFNTLNNFYGLAVEKSNKLPDLMIRLSELLRYSLYDTTNQTVPILNEIAYLHNYIELEKIRLEDNLDFDFTTKIEKNTNLEIAPLIFVVFIENAFKHAKNSQDKIIKIRVNLEVNAEKTLLFEVKNNFYGEINGMNTLNSGLGLENVKKRLEVLYPQPLHTLELEKKDDFFFVSLRINLKPV